MTPKTKAYAVLIGVDDYSTYDATNKHNLLGCVNDVRAFWDVCVTSGFAPENIHVLTNPPIDPAELGGLAQNFKTATHGNILAEQEALVALLRADPRAVGLLVYSGHGAWIDNASENSAVICPSDFWMDIARPNNDIPVNKLWQGAGSNLTVVLDCCHSGGRNRHGSHPIIPRDRHRKHLPTGRSHAPHEEHVEVLSKVPSDVIQSNQGSPKQGSPDQGQPDGNGKDAFSPLAPKNLGEAGLLPIGSHMPLTLTTRVLTEADLEHSPYRHAERQMGGARVLAACDVHEAAYQAEFAGRFHGAFTWAVTSTVGQWRVEESGDGAIRTTIGCGAVKRHATSLLEVFNFKQTPVLHPMNAVNLPFFGLAGPISENPTGDVFPAQIDPEIKILQLALSDDFTGVTLSKLEIAMAQENWSLGSDFMRALSRAAATSHTALSFRVTTTPPTPMSPVTTFRMPTRVNWGTAVAAPGGPAFYSTGGPGPAGLVMFFRLDMTSSPARVLSIDWYQGVTGATPLVYPLTSPGRDLSFATGLPTALNGLTWFHAVVTPL